MEVCDELGTRRDRDLSDLLTAPSKGWRDTRFPLVWYYLSLLAVGHPCTICCIRRLPGHVWRKVSGCFFVAATFGSHIAPTANFGYRVSLRASYLVFLSNHT
jgi:hypothetical protein